MPLRYGALRSREESWSSKVPRRSMQAMCAELRRSGLSAASSASTPSALTHQSSEGGGDPPQTDNPPPRWWPFVDSGMLSTLIFLIAMVMYLASVGPYGCEEESVDDASLSGEDSGECLQKWRLAAKLFLAANILFVVHSLIEVWWSVKRWRVQLQLVSAQIGSEVVDEVPWDFLSAVFFVIASTFLLVSSLLDSYAMGDGWAWTWLVIGHSDSESYFEEVEYPIFCTKLAEVFVTFGAILGVAGRCSYRAATSPEERLLVFQVWKATRMFDVDWAAWADMFFFVGAVVSIEVQYQPYNVLGDWSVDVLWTLDALMYTAACWPTLRAMTAECRRDGAPLANEALP